MRAFISYKIIAKLKSIIYRSRYKKPKIYKSLHNCGCSHGNLCTNRYRYMRVMMYKNKIISGVDMKLIMIKKILN